MEFGLQTVDFISLPYPHRPPPPQNFVKTYFFYRNSLADFYACWQSATKTNKNWDEKKITSRGAGKQYVLCFSCHHSPCQGSFFSQCYLNIGCVCVVLLLSFFFLVPAPVMASYFSDDMENSQSILLIPNHRRASGIISLILFSNWNKKKSLNEHKQNKNGWGKKYKYLKPSITDPSNLFSLSKIHLRAIPSILVLAGVVHTKFDHLSLLCF